MRVYTGGTFDLFHWGHVNFLRQCKKIAQGGEVIVALNEDSFVEKYKGRKPYYDYRRRKMMLEACRYVDLVVENWGGEDSRPIIDGVKPDAIVIADDWAKKDYYKQMSFTQEWLDERNITLIYIPYTKGVSTTELRK